MPLVFFTQTSEVFEFNKIILLYAGAISLITIPLTSKSFRFPNRWLIGALIFWLGTQTLSTFFSIDPITSFFGYYSRFNGGLLSSVAYIIIFLVIVNFWVSADTHKLLRVLALGSIPVIGYGFLQKLGLHHTWWVQDTSARIFSTFGQPNWLAAYLVGLAPITWFLAQKDRRWFVLLGANLLALLLTKSESGFVALIIVILVYLLKPKITLKIFKVGVVLSLVGLSLFFILVSHWSTTPTNLQTPALERPGTSSWEIRKIVWQGAWQIFTKNPILGSGTETFAFAYWQNRPTEQNLTSEWNFTYNKAHNEILNVLANNGFFGLMAYLFLIFVFTYRLIFTNSPFSQPLLAGFVGLNICHFFGFSTVTTSFLFFLFPALIIKGSVTEPKTKYLSKGKFIFSTLLLSPLLFFVVCYWLADFYYARASRMNQMGQPIMALADINHSIKYIPFFSDYWGKQADIKATISLLYYETGDIKTAINYSQETLTDIDKALALSPKNIIVARNKAALQTKLSLVNPKLINEAIQTLIQATALAPTDPKIPYHLGNLYYQQKQFPQAVRELTQAITLKPDYKEAHLTLAAVYESSKQPARAREEYQYILDHIAPHDPFIQSKLK